MRSGGKILIDGLVAQGVTALFTVPGESFLPALDALRDCPAIRTVVCRHEGGAAMMAEATARLSGSPAVAMVTRAPGAANAVAGVVCAAASAAPLLLVVGLPRSDLAGRDGAFQDIDVEAVFGSLAKWIAVCRDATRIPESVERAVRVALSGRPGPVVLGIPQDVLAAKVAVQAGVQAGVAGRVVPAAPVCDDAGLAELQAALAAAEQPLVIVGGPGWTDEARAALQDFAAAYDLPVAAAFRRQDAFDNRHPSYVGHCGIAPARALAAAMRAADLVILAGAAADEITSGGWQLLPRPQPARSPAPSAARRVAAIVRDPLDAQGADMTLLATPATLAPMLARLTPPWRGGAAPWAAWRRDLKAAWRASLDLPPPPAQLAAIFAALSELLPDDAVICGGAGNYAAFLHRYFVFKSAATSLSPPSGSMGYGLPAAIAASLHAPETDVVAVAGDGCFLMTAQEMATAAQYGARVLVVVVNNGLYGTIRMHQELSFPGRAFATRLANPDFVALARSFGAHAVRVTDATAMRAALADCLPRAGLRLIEIIADPDEIAPETRLSALGARDMNKS